jgi:proline racemase
MINGHEEVFVETKGKLHKTPAKFSSEDELIAGITAIMPSIQGWARVTGHNQIIVDDEDPYAFGFQVV